MSVGIDTRGEAVQAFRLGGASQDVSLDGTNANQSTDLSPTTTKVHAATGDRFRDAAADDIVVRLDSDVDCNIRIGTNPTAVATDMKIRANTPEHFTMPAGQKISAIATSAGTLRITVAG